MVFFTIDNLKNEGEKVKIKTLRGSTSPLLIYEKKKSVFKYSENIEKMYREWLSTKIAQSLKIPVPNVRWNKINLGYGETVGLEFEFIENIDFIEHCHSLKIPLWKFFNTLSNSNQLIDLFCFDLWIDNIDRSSNLGNILIKFDGLQYLFVAIDHGECFINLESAQNNKIELPVLKETHPFPFHHVHDIIKLNITFEDGFDETFSNVINAINSFNLEKIDEFLNEIPYIEIKEKIIDQNDKYKLFLRERREELLPFLTELYVKNWFPHKIHY